MNEKLTTENFIMFAMRHYENPAYTGFSEFKEDLSRIKYIKRLLLKYKKTNSLKERLILNHIIILKNMFGARNCCRILFFKLPDDLHSPLKSFFDYLNYTPSSIPEVCINSIQSDENVLKILRDTL